MLNNIIPKKNKTPVQYECTGVLFVEIIADYLITTVFNVFFTLFETIVVK